MKKALVLAAIVAAAAPQAFAQAKNFEGFSLGANLTSARTTTDLTPTGVATTSDSANTIGLDLQAQYSMALGSNFVLGLGASLGTIKNKAGTIGATEFTTKDRYSLDFVPGYVLSPSMLLYGKLGILNATGVSTTAGADTTTSLTGSSYGVGVRGLIDKNLYYQVGYDMNQYNEKDVTGGKIKPTASVFSFGVGYKF